MTIVIDGTLGVRSVNGSAAAPSVTGTDTDTGIVYGTNTLSLATGGTTAVTVDSSQNVGIGTSSPTQKLDVNGNIRTGGELALSGSDFVYSWAGGTTGQRRSGMYMDGSNQVLRFYTAQAEAARIDSSGNLLVGTTSVSAKFCVQTSGANQGVFSYNVDTATTSSYLFWGYANGASRFIVYGNGGIGNVQANNVNLSDRNEKTDFSPAGSYLDKICAIPVQMFKYIDQQDDELNLGVVAQDVQAVAPELVTESNWGSKDEPKMRLSIYQTDLQYALMKCIQEQQAIIEQLRADVETLKGNV